MLKSLDFIVNLWEVIRAFLQGSIVLKRLHRLLYGRSKDAKNSQEGDRGRGLAN